MNLNIAKKTIENPWTTTPEEKLDIIDSLKYDSSDEAIDILEQFLEMVNVPLKGQSETASKPIRAGKVSAHAARVLAENNNPRGFAILSNIIRNDQAHSFLREAALYGLLEKVDTASIELFIVGLEDQDYSNKLLSFSATQNTVQSLERDGFDIPSHLLFGLLSFVVENLDEDTLKNATKEALVIITKNINSSAEDFLISKYGDHENINFSCNAVRILGSNLSENSKGILLEALNSKDCHPEIYKAIGEIFSLNSDEEIRFEAERILCENRLVRKMTAAFLKTKEKSLQAREEAASKILGFTD